MLAFASISLIANAPYNDVMSSPVEDATQETPVVDLSTSLIRRATTYIAYPRRRLLSGFLKYSDIQYKQLESGSIRILYLRPGRFDDPLRGKLRHVRLADLSIEREEGFVARLRGTFRGPCKFEAVSYAWGNLKLQKRHPLTINGNQTLYISDSLFEALRHFRRRYQERRLWVDKICINQTDNKEMNVQVHIMGKIYGAAERVLIWLGRAEDNDVDVFAAMNSIAGNKLLVNRPEPYGFEDLLEKLGDLWYCLCCRQSTSHRGSDPTAFVHAFLKLLERQWFARMWVIQEVISSTSAQLCSGQHRAEWSSFRYLLGTFHHIALSTAGEPQHKPVKDILDTAQRLLDLGFVYLPRNDKRNNGDGFGVDNVLNHMSAYSSFGCGDPRDRIFAVRPVLQIEDMPTLKPDYNLQPAEVFRRFTATCLRLKHLDDKAYELFAFVGTEGPGERLKGLPSWVPNFHQFTKRSRYKHRQYTCHQYRVLSTFKAEASELKVDVHGNDSPMISVRGRTIGRISSINRDCSWPTASELNEQDLETGISLIAQWYLRCKDFAESVLLDPSDLLTFLSRGYSIHNAGDASQCDLDGIVLLMERVLKKDTFDESERSRCLKDISFLLHEGFLKEPRDGLDGMHIPVDPEQLLCRIDVEGTNVLAWVPNGANEDDVVCTFSGAPFPFVLRKATNKSYKLLGDAYIISLTEKQVFGHHAIGADATRFLEWNWRGVGTINPQLGKKLENLIKKMDNIELV